MYALISRFALGVWYDYVELRRLNLELHNRVRILSIISIFTAMHNKSMSAIVRVANVANLILKGLVVWFTKAV